MADQEWNCPECKKMTEIVFDRAAGDTICSVCGLILEEHYIDETSEWRNFANESADDKPDRVGGPSNPLLADCGLSTVIAGPSRARSDQSESQFFRKQRHASSDDSLIQAFSEIAQVVDRLGLVTTVKHRANELYKKANDQNLTRCKNKNAVLAACIYISCQQENVSRTPNEISSATGGVNKDDMSRAITKVKKKLAIEVEATGCSLIERFCSILGLNNRSTRNLVKQLVERCDRELNISNTPSSIVAAVIYLVTEHSDNKKPIKDISCATGVGPTTIRKVSKRIQEKFSPKLFVV